MVNLKNMGPVAFRNYIIDKKIVVFGAGRALDSCLEIYFENKEIEFVVDNNDKLWGTVYSKDGKDYKIESVQKLIGYYKNNRDIICFIDTPFYAPEIVEQLDSVPDLDGMDCYLAVIIRSTQEANKPWHFTVGPQRIPKRIHYIWIGEKELPDEYKQNIESWEKYNPEYEITQWNESNLTFDDCEYLKSSYIEKKWAYVSNYCRLKVIYENGGIYLDTDVKAIKSFDELLNDNAFFNMGCADRINNGCGFGAVKGNELVKNVMREYEKCDGLRTNIQGHIILNRVMKARGFEIENRYQRNDWDEVIYPSYVMSPLHLLGEEKVTERTVSIHIEDGSWKNDIEKSSKNIQKLVARIH